MFHPMIGPLNPPVPGDFKRRSEGACGAVAPQAPSETPMKNMLAVRWQAPSETPDEMINHEFNFRG